MPENIVIKASEEASKQLLSVAESFKGWNLICGLYDEPTETNIREISEEARTELFNSAQLILLGSFLQLSGKTNEYKLIQSALAESKDKMDELSARCSELIQKDDASDDNRADELTALLHPVLSYMAKARIANISINQLGKESR